MAKSKTAPQFISFASTGVCTGIGANGDYLLSFESTASFRYRLVDGVVSDLFEGLSDEEALAKLKADQEAADAEAVTGGVARQNYTIFKTTIIGRMSDKELAVFDAGYKAQDLRARMMWDNCTSVVSLDAYAEALRELFTAAYGAERSDELMAPL